MRASLSSGNFDFSNTLRPSSPANSPLTGLQAENIVAYLALSLSDIIASGSVECEVTDVRTELEGGEESLVLGDEIPSKWGAGATMSWQEQT